MRTLQHTINRAIFFLWARFKYPWLFWRLVNLPAIRSFRNARLRLSPLQERLLADLRSEGLAVTSLEELFGNPQLSARLAHAEEKLRSRRRQYHKKPFFIDYFDPVPKLDLDNPFVLLMLDPRILDVVNSYLELFARITYYTLQETAVTGKGRAFSQQWHRDPQEQRLCKVFLYLYDVDENTGPFTYVPRSSRGHEYARLFPQRPPHGSYPSAEDIERHLPKEKVRVVTGKAGTVIFCDTTGLHCGGYAKERSRIMLTLSYAAPTYRENQSYWYPASLLGKIREFPLQSQRALNPRWMQKDSGH
jgi:hypothetical protein